MFYLLKSIKNVIFFHKNKELRFSLLIFLISSLLFGLYMFSIENLSFVDTFYYLVTTATTVGYGDFSPTTSFGKILATLYMVISISVFGIILGTLGEKIINTASKNKKGLKKIKKKPGLVIIGYPFEEKVKELIQELRIDNSFENKDIVVISNSLEEKPDWFFDYEIDFVKGLGSNVEVLNKANISSAEIVLILAVDSNKIESDDFTSSAITVVRKLRPDIRIIAEKVRKDNVLFESVGCDTVSRVANAYLLSQEILDPGAIEFEQAIFSNEVLGTQFNCIYTGPTKKWGELVILFSKENAILEGFKKSTDLDFNFLPDFNDEIEANTLLKYRSKERLSIDNGSIVCGG